MPCVPSGALTRATVLSRRMADDGNGSKKAKNEPFSVFRAVASDGGRGGVQRTEEQRQQDEHKKKNMQQMMDEGMSSKEAFGQCSKNRAEERRSDELVTPVALGSPAPLSGRPPTPPTREGSGKERSPSFKPESDAWRNSHPEFALYEPRMRRKRTAETNEAIVCAGTRWSGLRNDMSVLGGAKLQRVDHAHGGKLVDTKPMVGARASHRASSREKTQVSLEGATDVDPRQRLDMGTVIQLSKAISHECFETIQKLCGMSNAQVAAEFVGVSEKYAAKVLGVHVIQGGGSNIPPGDERPDAAGGRGRKREGVQASFAMLSKRTVHKVRMLVIQGCRSGQPVYSKEIRTFISDETAKEGRRVVLGRQQLQALRERMGLVSPHPPLPPCLPPPPMPPERFRSVRCWC